MRPQNEWPAIWTVQAAVCQQPSVAAAWLTTRRAAQVSYREDAAAGESAASEAGSEEVPVE